MALFPSVPDGECKTENPDGVGQTEGFATSHNLYDTADQRPAIQSGDWQVRAPRHRVRDRSRDITE